MVLSTCINKSLNISILKKRKTERKKHFTFKKNINKILEY